MNFKTFAEFMDTITPVSELASVKDETYFALYSLTKEDWPKWEAFFHLHKLWNGTIEIEPGDPFIPSIKFLHVNFKRIGTK